MFLPLPLYIGLRYTRAKRRNQFISFVSLISLLGMVLGVFSLIVVLSVMNGFEKELRDRILSVVAHGFIDGPQQQLEDWPTWLKQLRSSPDIKNAAPYIDGNVMLSRPGIMKGAQLLAVSPEQEKTISTVAQHMVAGEFDALIGGDYGIIIGELLARQLGLNLGDSVTLVLPRVTVTPVGVFPRVKRFTVKGLFRVGAQLDSTTVFIHLTDGQKLFQLGNSVKGLRVELHDLFMAETVIPALAATFPQGAQTKTWKDTQGSLFQAVKMEKTMVSLLLLIIVAVAAFNIVSILIMMVADKRSDIAVLRTMGASPRTIMSIFMIQGIVVGFAGITVGIILAIPVALNVGNIVAWFEQLLGAQVFDPQVYFISHIPSILTVDDVVMVAVCGSLLSLVATFYPAYRASKIEPAEVLRYE